MGFIYSVRLLKYDEALEPELIQIIVTLCLCGGSGDGRNFTGKLQY